MDTLTHSVEIRYRNPFETVAAMIDLAKSGLPLFLSVKSPEMRSIRSTTAITQDNIPILSMMVGACWERYLNGEFELFVHGEDDDAVFARMRLPSPAHKEMRLRF